MIDFVKFIIKPNKVPNDLLENPLLNFTVAVNMDTGEVKKGVEFQEAEYRNLKFKLYNSGVLIVAGSLHKYFNKGIHNYNSFSKANLDLTLNHIEAMFGLKLFDCKIQNLEVGLNIKPPIKSVNIIKNILMHSNEPFKYYSIKGSEYKQAIHDRYSIKVYDKRMSYNNKTFFDDGKKQKHQIEDEILRFEVKYVKMKILNDIGIYTLEDLLSSDKLRFALELLCETWNRLIIYDPTIKTKNLTKYVKSTKLNQWQNVNYWRDLKKQRRLEQKEAMRRIVRVNSEDVKEKVANKFEMEIRELLFDFTNKRNLNVSHNSLPLHRKNGKCNSLPTHTSYIECEGNILCTHFNITNMVDKNYLLAV